MTGDCYFSFVTRPMTWEELQSNEQGIYPISKRYFKASAQLSTEDEILVYLSKESSFAGIIKVVQELMPYNKPVPFSGRVYEGFIKVKYQVVLPHGGLVPVNDLLKEMELTRRHRNWGALFQKAVLRLSEHDFNLIRLKILEKSNEKNIQI